MGEKVVASFGYFVKHYPTLVRAPLFKERSFLIKAFH